MNMNTAIIAAGPAALPGGSEWPWPSTSVGCAVFLGNEEKVFAIYVEQSVGLAIALVVALGRLSKNVVLSNIARFCGTL